MKRVLIAGIGNVLLGDDGVGPYVVRVSPRRLSSRRAYRWKTWELRLWISSTI